MGPFAGDVHDNGNVVDTDACTALCAMATCGDGIVQADVEGCDDGNQVDNDTCSNTCASPKCGDKILQPPEACDDGNADDTDTCTQACKAAICGDGFVNAGVETCDDKIESATCDLDCTKAQCGDKVVNPTAGETCDDGGQSVACDVDCTPTVCGDAVVNMAAGETCDDGNAINTDACVGACKTAKCGDGFAQAGVEQCDDGNAVDNDACSNTCKVNVACGGWSWNGGCWYTAPAVNMSCTQVCAPHGGFNAVTSQHAGNQAGLHFWPAKANGSNWVTVECSSTDNNTNWGANGAAPDANFSHAACHVNCSCNN